jgi:hypothetical protein
MSSTNDMSDTNRGLKTHPDGAATSSGEELALAASPRTHPLSLQERNQLAYLDLDDKHTFEKEENFKKDVQLPTIEGKPLPVDPTNLVRGQRNNFVGAFNVTREGITRTGNNDDPMEESGAFSVPSVEQECSTNLVVEAVRVEDSNDQKDVEERVRQRILKEAVTADVVAEPTNEVPTEGRNKKRFCAIIALLLILVAVAAVAIGLGVNSDSNIESMLKDTTPSDETAPADDPTTNASRSSIETILDRGFIRCGVYDDMPGFSYISANGTFSGFNYRLVSTIIRSINTILCRYGDI